MTPYLEFQLLYFALAAVGTTVLWLAAGRRPSLKSSTLRRYLVLVVLFLLFLGFSAFTIRLVMDRSRTFFVVAMTFYGAVITLPVLVLGHVFRRRRAEGAQPACVLLAVVSLGLAAYALLVEPHRLQLREETVTVAGWPATAPPFRIVHLSDLQTVGPNARQDRAVEMINELDADLIVITGDYIAGPFHDVGPAVSAARDFLRALRARHGVVVIQGHSEPERYRKQVFRDLGLTYLVDETHTVALDDTRRVRIHGARVHRPRPGALVPADDPATFTILASHVPDLEPVPPGVDLHLAGHTHGGQVVIPFWGAPVTLTRLPRRYARGLHDLEGRRININAGLGMEGNHAPRIRFLCPPEICLVTLRGE